MSARDKIAASLKTIADEMGAADATPRPVLPDDGIADYDVRALDKIAEQTARIATVAGGGGSGDMFFVVHNGNIVDGADCLDKTGQEILDAYLSGKIIVATVYLDPFGQQLSNDVITDICRLQYYVDGDNPYVTVEGGGISQQDINIYYGTEDNGLSSYPHHLAD